MGDRRDNGAPHNELADALNRLEQSESLARKPNQARLFRFLARRLLEGTNEPVKEYVLGVEALGRPADFDPKTDSIVRVEIHKLRRTLESYYESGPGRDEALLIRLPKGAYNLEVVWRGAEPPAGQRAARWRRYVVMAASGLVFTALLAWVLARRAPSTKQLPGAVARATPAAPLQAAPGHTGNLTEGFTDSAGRSWDTDRYFEGGLAVALRDFQAVNVDEPRLFRHHREGQFSYHIPLPPGLYELRLYFAEFLYGQGGGAGGGETSRLFRILINGRVAADPLDIVASAPGRGVGMRRVFLNVSPAGDGKLHLSFENLRPDKALVNAIEVVPGVKDRMLPLRMVAAARPARDAQGNLWEPDSFVLGGRRVERSRTIAGAPSESLFQSERFGHFTYHLHAVPGHRYRLNLWFAEQYFGFPGASPSLTRRFDLWANGETLLRSFDLMQEAGGPGRAIRKSFSGLRTDAYGAIRLHFVPVSNYAMVNALELIDEGPE